MPNAILPFQIQIDKTYHFRMRDARTRPRKDLKLILPMMLKILKYIITSTNFR